MATIRASSHPADKPEERVVHRYLFDSPTTSSTWFVAANLIAAAVLSCGEESSAPIDINHDGSVSVTSSVPGAEIVLDGAATGFVTPDTLSGLIEGTHRIGVLLAGYYLPPEQVIEVVADSVIYVHFKLAQIPVTGSIAVTSSIPGAAIELDGKLTNFVTPDTLLGIAEGPHTIGVSLEGYYPPGEQQVIVSANSLSVVHFVMVQLPGAIAVSSSTQGAAIILDSVETGLVTPDTLRDVATGIHHVRVLLENHYRPAEQVVKVGAGDVASVYFELVPILGRVVVTSSVPGAAIFLDRTKTGLVTPDTLRDLSKGSHRIGVHLAGYWPPIDQIVDVAFGSMATIHFDLLPISEGGAVAVTAPYPAEILVDGVPTGLVAPDTLVGLVSGEHAVTLELPGFRSVPPEHRLVVIDGKSFEASFDLVVDKLVVCEDFSNYACIPCPPADAALLQAMSEVGAEHVIMVNPHTFFPALADPFYQFNLGANRARIFFNQVQVAPTILIDGGRVPQTEVESPAALRTRIESALAGPAPIGIGVEGELTLATFEITVDVWGIASSIPSNLLLFAWVVEEDVTLDPPGPNGQSHYTNVLRHLFPTPESPNGLGGLALGAISPGEHRTYAFTYDLPPGDDVNPQELRAVAFAQEQSGGRRVVQTGMSYLP